MLRSRPSDIDQVPYGYEEIAENASKAAASPIQAGVALKTAMKSKTFYMFAALCGLISFYTCVNFYWDLLCSQPRLSSGPCGDHQLLRNVRSACR